MRKTGKHNKRIVFFVLFFVLFFNLLSEEIEITASVNSNKIGMDDVLVYTLKFKGIENPQQPGLSNLDNFKIAQTSRSTEFRFVNGVSSYYTNFVYYLMPLKKGTLTIPPVSYENEGKQYQSEPMRVEVVEGSVAPKATPRRNQRRFGLDEDDFFSSPFQRRQQQEQIDVKLKPVLSSKQVITGEQVIFKILLYTRNRVESVNMISNQSFPGFWQEWASITNQIQGKTEIIDGKSYQVFKIRKAALFPTKTGQITIPSLKFELAMLTDSYSIFSNSRRIYRTTPEITIDVYPLPSGAANLPVGSFKFEVTPSKEEININDILTLQMKIRGRGNIKIINPPLFDNSEYYKVYPEKISRSSDFNGDAYEGRVNVEIPIAFKKIGRISFPPLEFKYVNPVNSKIITLRSKSFNVKVIGLKEKQENAVTIPRTEIIKKGEDIDFIKKGEIYDQQNYFYKTGTFRFLAYIFFVINIFVVLKIFVFDRYISQSQVLKKRILFNKTIKQLKDTHDYGEIFPILEAYLNQKTDLGLSEINNFKIEEIFEKYGVSNNDIKIFSRIKSESESSRFSPLKKSDKELHEDLKTLIEILKRVDKKIK
jgi:hypothetical protein